MSAYFRHSRDDEINAKSEDVFLKYVSINAVRLGFILLREE